MTTPRSPRTEAGKRLNAKYLTGKDGYAPFTEDILAIEAEAGEGPSTRHDRYFDGEHSAVDCPCGAAPRSGEGLREALHEAVNDVPWSTRTLPLYREDILKAIDYALAAAPQEAGARVVSTRRADSVVIDPDAFGPVHGAPREASEPDV